MATLSRFGRHGRRSGCSGHRSGHFNHRTVHPTTSFWVAAALLAATGVAAVAAGTSPHRGPGDPTTLFLSGFGNSCRLGFDADGVLFANDQGTFYRVTPDGTKSLFTDAVPDARGFAIDAFGNLLVASPQDSAIYQVNPQAQASVFTRVYNARSLAMDLDGSVWASAVDTIHHFDARGRHLESIDLGVAGAAAFGIQVSPQGEPHFSNFAGLWKLSSGTPVPLATGLPLMNRGFALDGDGNIYWARDAMDQADTDRVILYDPSGQVIHDTIIGQVTDPCSITFLRDEQGNTTNRILVSQMGGTIVEANASGISTGGWPTVPLSIGDIVENDCADQAAGAGTGLTDQVIQFLDAIGNNNGSYDVGDFRAYLLATGAIQ